MLYTSTRLVRTRRSETQQPTRTFRDRPEKKRCVHKFITKGTIEEIDLDKMIEGKLKLAQERDSIGRRRLDTAMNNDE